MEMLTVDVESLKFGQTDSKWLADMKPYHYQDRVYQLLQGALTRNETLCLFLVTPTGSGKTLGSYAYAINNQIPAFGAYPTNALIRDQEEALKDWIDPYDQYRLLRIDSKQLDHWQDRLDLKRHASTLERLMNWRGTILTNPDILFYTFFSLYSGPSGFNQRLFALLGQYQVFIFDEFHLYNVKQMADVAFLVGTLHTINPERGRVFLFASATPDSPAHDWLQKRLHLQVKVVKGKSSNVSNARTIAYPLQLSLLPANLRHWKGVETLMEYLPTLQRFLSDYPEARIVTILDSVVGAIEVAQKLRDLFAGKPVGEIHGLSSDEERETAIQQPLTVGTSTIEVGIDFKEKAEKDVLIYEARTAGQFVQRFGRLARHKKSLPIPNLAVALVPEYVYHFLTDRLSEGESLSRDKLYRLVEEGYQKQEDFARYLKKHAPAEFQEARQKVRASFQQDDWPRIETGLKKNIKALTGATDKQAWGKYHYYKEERILKPLLTFRSSGFQAAILDERGADAGFPAKRYNLMFLLRRGEFTEIGEEAYLERLEALENQWLENVTRERRYAERIGRKPDDLLGVYGYFRLTGLLNTARKVWFEVNEDAVYGHVAQVTTLKGLEVVTDPRIRLRRLNRHLKRKHMVAWFAPKHPAAVHFGKALPPLFAVYELRVVKPGGQLSDQRWSIVFNQDAFFVDSLGWWTMQQKDRAIML